MNYPLFIRPTAKAVARGEAERGIVLGGSGNGEDIVRVWLTTAFAGGRRAARVRTIGG